MDITTKKEVFEKIEQNKLVAIARAIPSALIVPAVRAVFEGGVRLLEITFDQSSADLEETCDSIRLIREEFGGGLCVGAGTVMNQEQLEAAAKAGAAFILSPNTDKRVIRAAIAHGLCMVAGAMTPSEVAYAYECGADIVKIFPAGNLGLDYI